MNLQDVERLQTLYPEHQVELRAGKLILTSPIRWHLRHDRSAVLGGLLANWVSEHNLGTVFNSSTGFRLPNGDLLSPDVSFLRVTPSNGEKEVRVG